jgi:hypothetical protein
VSDGQAIRLGKQNFLNFPFVAGCSSGEIGSKVLRFIGDLPEDLLIIKSRGLTQVKAAQSSISCDVAVESIIKGKDPRPDAALLRALDSV